MSIPQAIREGDRFEDDNGVVWEVWEVLPGWRVGIIDRARCRSGYKPYREVRQWKRLQRVEMYL